MRRIVLGAMLLMPLAVTACSSSPSSNSVTAPTTSSTVTSTPTTTTPIAAAPSSSAPTSSSSAVLSVGQSVTVLADQTKYGAPLTQVQVTLLGSRSAMSVITSYGTVDRPHPGMKFVCESFRVRNTGTGTPDLPSIRGQWVGANGQTQAPQVALEDCSDLGVGKQGQALVSQPNPAAGQYIEGWIASEVPAGPGVLVWSRNLDNTELFRTPG
ncbi:hypothetical protein EDD99_2896 [Streptomyces sp. 846.5]|nr:hypothetical protein [Streptomyces sp. 846.5]TDU04436.1 hypothetical protein EDD99_2896 [Streptomyces sp. 846.5]